MNFKEWLLTEKYINRRSTFCEICHGPLYPFKLVENPKHIYDLGQLWKCKCGKSSVWTNSVRNGERLVAFLKGQEERYINGFCNDAFCGECFDYLQPLKNGVDAPFQHPNRMDRWGCENGHNENILRDGFLEDKEGETQYMMMWYTSHMGDLIRAMRKQGVAIQ